MFDSWLPKLSPAARALLGAERVVEEDERLKMRALERAEATLEGERWSGILPRLTVDPLPVRASGFRSMLLVAAVVTCASLAAASAGWVLVRSRSSISEAPAPVVVAPTPRAAVTPRPLPRPSRDFAAVANDEPSAPPVASVVSTRARPSSARQYAIELALLEPARSSVARRDYNAALGAIAQHQHEYPGGQLAEEREALRVRALWGLGQKPAAEAAAAAFRKRYPRSVLLSWMKAEPAP